MPLAALWLPTPEESLAAAIKLCAALPVLRWPLAGALIAIAADGADVVIMNYVDLGGGGIRRYHVFDKWTDVPALVTFAIALGRWPLRDRAIGWGLLALRAVGVGLFEFSGARWALFAFPNWFEVWFLTLCVRDRAGPRPATLFGGLAVIVKLAQEYVVHVAQTLDRLVLARVVRDLWNMIAGGR